MAKNSARAVPALIAILAGLIGLAWIVLVGTALAFGWGLPTAIGVVALTLCLTGAWVAVGRSR